MMSEEAISQLAGTCAELEAIEERTTQLVVAIQARQEPLGPLKTELAQLEARAHKIETQGVDNIYTGQLNSGKEEAKGMKRSVLHRIEVLLETIDSAFKALPREV